MHVWNAANVKREHSSLQSNASIKAGAIRPISAKLKLSRTGPLEANWPRIRRRVAAEQHVVQLRRRLGRPHHARARPDRDGVPKE